MIAYVAGHTHENEVRFFGGRRGRGFWEINTASHIDWPQQSRLLEVMDNRDGTLSIFGTILDSAAPAAAPAPGNGDRRCRCDQLVSLGRTLSYNDPQRARPTASGEDRRQARRGAATATSSCWCATRASTRPMRRPSQCYFARRWTR